MATIVESTIGSGGDYSTIQSWSNDTDNDLVTADEQHNGLLLTTETLSGTVVVSGATTDATRYRNLTFDSGNRYDHTDGSGAVVDCGSSNYFSMREGFIRVTGIKVTGSTGGVLGDFRNTCDDAVVDGCVFENTNATASSGIAAKSAATDQIWRNCMFIGTDVEMAFQATDVAGLKLQNCTADGDGLTGIQFESGTPTASTELRNCVATGFDTAFTMSTGTSTGTYDTNASDDTSSPGTTTYDSLVRATIFADPANDDFTPVTGEDLVDNGTDLSGSFTTDITGATRGASFDIGAYELVTAGKTATGGVTVPVPTIAGVGEVGVKTATGGLTAPLPTIAGVGTVSSPPALIEGSGGLTVPLPTIAGVGEVGEKTATGGLTVPLPTIVGVGEVGEKTATGGLTVPLPTIAGVGEVGEKTATGGLTVPLPTIAGVGVLGIGKTATGGVTVPLPTIAGVGEVGEKTATGGLTVPLPTIAGVGIASTALTATGGLTVPLPTIAGVGNVGVDKTATGGLTVPLPTLGGTAVVSTPTFAKKFLVDINLNGNNIVQPESAGATAVVGLEQLDSDQPFLNFVGSSDIDDSASVSSDTNENSLKYGSLMIQVNGVTKWLRVYDDPD